ncbi:hypothetical protein C3489_00445 [Streptomyces sp. Ru71]|uniref:hypothetical protein n=1 Tax=Streptomyces sp. Ru71 TaxID=2080746 RepID=UPI000CDCE092|nr:hypothetical protein [Streptomyces sp. Ru71]POX57228.1 hypothetical protein C3489_00445 [Streptomyces sp. Ru71]
MSDSSLSSTELTSQYLAQVTSDLEHNTKERERISAEITALQEQFAALQHDFAVLQNMRRALEGTSAAAEARAVPETAVPESPAEAVVPAPRKAGSRASGAGKRTAPKAAKATKTAKSATAPRSTAKKKQPAKKSTAAKSSAAATSPAAKSSGASTGAPKLVELVRRHLAEQKEPRSAAEITEALGKAYPERSVKTTVVRTTLESLVARNQAQRTKQGTSVFYTAPEATAANEAQAEAPAQDGQQES